MYLGIHICYIYTDFTYVIKLVFFFFFFGGEGEVGGSKQVF